MGFVSNFLLSSSAKILKIGLRFDKVTESLKEGTFLGLSVYLLSTVQFYVQRLFPPLSWHAQAILSLCMNPTS